jgi:hypothetical protein
MEQTIRTILAQVTETKVQIGHAHGHYISEGQVAAIRRALGDRPTVAQPSAASPSTPAPYLGDLLEIATLEEELRLLNERLDTAPKSSKPAINLEIGAKQSRLTRLKKNNAFPA